MKIGFRMVLILIILGMIIGMLLNMQIGGVSAKPAYVPPAPTKTPLEIEMEVKAAVSSFYMWLLIKWGMVIIVLLAGFWAVMRFLVVPAQKHAKTHYRDESGRYGMIRENKATLWQRLRGISIWVESDPNLAIAPARRIKVLSDGEMEVAADTYGADMEVQARHASKQIDVDKISAGHALGRIPKIPGGSGVYKKSQADYMQEAGVFEARSAEAKMKRLTAETNLQNAQIRQQKLIEGPAKGSVEEIEKSIPQYEKIGFLDAMELSKHWSYKKAEIVIGQAGDDAKTDAGMIGKIDIIANPMIMVSGKPNSGKTKGVAFTIVAAAVRWGWSVVLFEPKSKMDWMRTFKDHVAYHEMTSDNADAHLTMLENEYKRRSTLLKDNGFIEWNECEESTRLCPPMLVVIEEFAVTIKRLSATRDGETDSEAKKRVRRFWTRLTIMILEARASGIMMLIVQQRPNDYPADMLSSFKHIVYTLEGMGQGTVCNSPRNHLLIGQGHFDMAVVSRTRSTRVDTETVFFWGFDTKHDINQFLAKLPPTPMDHNLAPNGCCESVEEIGGKKSKQAMTSQPTPSTYTKPIAPDPITDRREPVTEVEYSLQRIYERDKNKKHGKWKSFVEQYIKLADKFPEDHPMRKYPVAEIADRMAVCELGRYDKDLSDRRKSQASQWYSKIMAERQPEQAEPVIAGMSMSEWQEIPV